MAKQVKRRSIVEFERWLDGEIASVQATLAEAVEQAEEIARRQATEEIRLETLQSVKAKLTPPGDEAEEPETTPTADVNGAEPVEDEPVLKFEDPEPETAPETERVQ